MVPLKLAIPSAFFKEEVRCGYHIDTKMKEVWAVEMDLLAELLRVCKKHDIRIFASGGTLLGAVRHGGFIPWDDDIDLIIMRDQYDQLCAIAQQEFQAPYFFQTEYSDPGSLRGHAQLRNSDTTAILRSEQGKCTFNQGIFIDIFPLDSVVEDETLLKEQEAAVKLHRDRAYWYSLQINRNQIEQASGILSMMKRKIIQLSHIIPKEYQKFERECAKYNDRKTEWISSLSFQFANTQHYKTRADFDEVVEIPFEFMLIPAPKNYDHALKMRFGDYHEFVMGGNCHGEILFDTEKSYRYYVNTK